MDVFTCIAIDELSTPESLQSNVQCATSPVNHVHSSVERADVLETLGLQDLNLEACEMSDECKDRLLDLIKKYESREAILTPLSLCGSLTL